MAVLEMIIFFLLIAVFNHPLNFAIRRRSWTWRPIPGGPIQFVNLIRIYFRQIY